MTDSPDARTGTHPLPDPDPDATARLGPAAAAPPPGSPPALPGFDLRAEVGRGGMGVVWRAWDRPLGREVAVKLLGDRAAARDAAARFREEARITARLQHPGVPAVYQAGAAADGRPFLAMKLIEGHTLEARLRAGRPVDAAGVFEAVAQAVGYAHAHGIVHRDLKPANVMVGAFGEVQVMDWGLAKPVAGRDRPGGAAVWGVDGDTPAPGPDTPFTQAGSVVGTPAYMAPEQAAGGRYDARSDVFGLGALLCALLTGRPPFAGADAASVCLAAAAGATAEALARLDGCGADPGLVALCKRCLATDPGERPADGAAVAAAVADLRRAAADRARQAEVDRGTAEVRAAEQARRRRQAVAAGAAVAAALLVGLAAAGAGLWRADRSRRAEAEQRAVAEQKEREAAGVLRFVRERVLAAAKPVGQPGGLGKDVTLKAALLASLPAVDDGFPDQPLVEARLRGTLGATLLDLGDPAAALAQYRPARRLLDDHLGPDHPDAVYAANDVADALLRLDRHADALAECEPLVARARAALGPDHEQTLMAMNNLAIALNGVGRADDSLRLTEECLERRRAALGPDHSHTLMSLNNLGNMFCDAGRLADGLRLTEECLAARRRVLGPDATQTLMTQLNLGETFTDLGRHPEALAAHQDALPRCRRVLGPDHPYTLHAGWKTAAALAQVGLGAEAVPLADDTLRRAAGRAVPPGLVRGLIAVRLRLDVPAAGAGWLSAAVAAWHADRATAPPR